jgi:hypothetical protein
MNKKIIKAKLWLYILNCGDGSCNVLFFDSEKAAEKYAKKDDERMCEDIFMKTIEIDEDGKLVTPNPQRK